jgi:hypothetical protein
MPSHRIICKTCAKRPLGEYSGEWAKRVSGRARKDYLCDQCDAGIPKESPCVAESFGQNRTPYIPWEWDYIKME